jgi:diguanylate cyclase (GGDEF)-like protein
MPTQASRPHRPRATAGAYLRRRVLLRLAAFVLMCVPLLWLGVTAELRQLDTIAQRDSNRDVENMARAFAEEINATVSTIDMSLLHLRSHWERDPGQFARMVERLNRELHGRIVLQVSVTDARGRQVFPAAAHGTPIDLSGLEQVSHHLKGGADELFVSRPVRDAGGGQWSVQFTRQLHDADGKVTGVIVVSVPPAHFTHFYASIDLGPDMSTSLVRSDGTVLARVTHGALDRFTGSTVLGYPYQRERQDSPAGGLFHRVGQLDHVERNYAFRYLPDYPLLVTVGQSVADAGERFARQKAMVERGGVAATVLVTLLAWMMLASYDNRRRAAKALQAAEARWKLALSAAGEGVWDWDLASGMATLSPRAQEIVDSDGPTMLLTRGALQRLVHPDDLPRVTSALKEHFETGSHDFAAEMRIALRSGGWRWIVARGMVAERDDAANPRRMVGTFADIEARKCQEEQIRHQANHDALTGLPNRLLFGDRLRQALRVAQREHYGLAVLYFDLDKFKPVNDTYGHAIGDALLVAVARRVEHRLRDSDTLARIGGDEFVVLLPRCAGPDDARKVGDTILAQLNREFVVEGHALHISGSIGYALFPEHGRDGEALLRGADQAMYEAKTNGRGQVRGFTAAAGAPAGD